ncbi:MAG: prepilin-type N-terminal cleavage/methylation domain-containing protein [Verrucomicrobia bacterium]|nr:prepilin-type N-terminal cleavage/methylation domain-containing protein [Verrucomicrobiota bacterium]MCH8513993.1 prepilin-type N-terminal cleavage/methylation domain-containing protein [Kiritimatiellia bacterium]
MKSPHRPLANQTEFPSVGSPPKKASERRKRRFGVRTAREGFSLIEVLLAVLVLGLSLVAFFGALGDGVAIVASASQYETARTLMNKLELMEPLDLEDLDEGEDSGHFDGDFRNFRWRRTITLASKEEDELYRIETRIEWGDHRDPGVESVETYLHLPTARREGWVKDAVPFR